MYRQWWLRLAMLALLVVGLCSAQASEAFAEATVEVLPAPEVEPMNVSTHGDGSVTIANVRCDIQEYEAEDNGIVTISPTGTVLSETPRIEKDGSGEWPTLSCLGDLVSGFDSTTYVVQRGSYIVAIRNNSKLWATDFESPIGYKQAAVIDSVALGKDGNLYAVIYWGYENATHPEIEMLASISPSTGAVRFIDPLPNIGSSQRGYGFHELLPHEDGLAVLNGNEVFFYNYEGVKENSKTFTAALGEEIVTDIEINPETGRIYWLSIVYNPEISKYEMHSYYRDSNGSTNEKIELPEGKSLIGMFAAPDNGLVAIWEEKSGVGGFIYMNEEISEVYQKTLSSGTAHALSPSAYMVDDAGNVIARQVMYQSDGGGHTDRNVVIDSFSPSGVETRLFDSSSLGTKGVTDSFSSISHLAESVSKHHVYIMLCHVEGKFTEECDQYIKPVVVSISDSSIGNYDYPRSAIFSAMAEQSSYVALGDSYSSGEGVPSFIPPSDEDGCHRSYGAYPSVLASEVSGLRLDAFVACSGATTTDIEEGMKGEPSQLYALDSSTNLVTMTVGGNDVGFKEFVEECVIETCSLASPAYEYSMEQILSYLPAKLESLYEVIHSYAENAEVYVVGYPQVAPKPGVSCTFLTDSEKEAAREVVSYLDKAIKEAVESAGGAFHYVDPNSGTSPFTGHELCTAESYFNGVEVFNPEYSFHPNALGQEAYATLVAGAL